MNSNDVIFEHPSGFKKKGVKVKSDINPAIRKLLEAYVGELTAHRKYTPIHVDEITSKLARFYEATRKVINWKDDNALRRGAIERILKRLLFAKAAGITTDSISADDLAERVTLELIRGGHLPNDTVPRESLTHVSTALKKYLYFLDNTSNYKVHEVKLKLNYTNFILEIASCEIEEILTNPIKEYALIQAMVSIFEERVEILSEEKLDADEKQKYVFASVCRALFDLDDNFIIYHILGSQYPHWHNPSDEQTKAMAETLLTEWKQFETEINGPKVRKFIGISEHMNTMFLLIDDVLETLQKTPEKIIKVFESKKLLKKHIEKAYNHRHKTLKRRLFRLGVFSTLSVFLSNWFTFFVVEIPLAKIFYEEFNLVAAIADFLIPTFVMFVLVMIIKPPSKDNASKVLTKTLGIIYLDEKHEQFQIRIREDKLSFIKVLLYSLYVYSMILVFLLIGYVFYLARLPMTSVIFDTFTIALTVYAAVAIKNKARELSVADSTSWGDFLLDIISVPIAKVGSIFAKKWKEYNIASILFNFLVETPFVVILDFIQEWSEFIKERKTELR